MQSSTDIRSATQYHLSKVKEDEYWMIPVASFSSSIGTCIDCLGNCDCIIQLRLFGIPLRSIFVNTASLFRELGKGWPVLESIRLRRVCDTCVRRFKFRILYPIMSFRIKLILTCTTSWLHHNIAWCSIDNHTFLMLVLLIVNPWVEGTIPSRDSNLDRTFEQKAKELISTHQVTLQRIIYNKEKGVTSNCRKHPH